MLGERLKVCEAQTEGPWMMRQDKDGSWEISHGDEVLAVRMPWEHNADKSLANGLAMYFQHTERPQELEMLRRLLALDEQSLMMADERTIFLVNERLKVYESGLGVK